MDNLYTSQYAPQMMGDASGMPQQNTLAQQALMNQMMQQNQQMGQYAQPQNNAMQLAQMLRKQGQASDGVSPMQNLQAWYNSNFNRDQSVM
jgi:hypothetical protein